MCKSPELQDSNEFVNQDCKFPCCGCGSHQEHTGLNQQLPRHMHTAQATQVSELPFIIS